MPKHGKKKPASAEAKRKKKVEIAKPPRAIAARPTRMTGIMHRYATR